MVASDAQASEEYLKLRAFVEETQHGEVLEYKDVERRTGVPMDTKGRQKLRRAILASKRSYVCHPEVGYELASPGTTMAIVARGVVRLDNTRKRAAKDVKNLEEAFIDELPAEERQGLLYMGSLYRAIEVAAINGRKLYGTKRLTLDTSQIVIDVPNVTPFK
jgi:hypothetical protein